MKPSLVAGVAPLLLATLCRLVTGRSIPAQRHNPMCHNVPPCKEGVFLQIQCQVSQLNAKARDLLDAYLAYQGPPFSRDKLKSLCDHEQEFPSFANQTSDRKEKLISLYKIFAFLNASLGNISKNTENRSKAGSDLLDHLQETTNISRGLLSNLTCMLCSQYRGPHVDVTYGSSKKTAFEKKQQGCQVLWKYTKVISEAAHVLGGCHQQT